jgi:MraZ protein
MPHFSKNIYVSKGFDGCLELRNQKDFEAYAEKILKTPNTLEVARKVQRIFLGNTTNLEIDAAKRILLPIDLTKNVGINKEVVISGVGDLVEIWDKNKYDAYMKTAEKEYENVADKYARITQGDKNE